MEPVLHRRWPKKQSNSFFDKRISDRTSWHSSQLCLCRYLKLPLTVPRDIKLHFKILILSLPQIFIIVREKKNQHVVWAQSQSTLWTKIVQDSAEVSYYLLNHIYAFSLYLLALTIASFCFTNLFWKIILQESFCLNHVIYCFFSFKWSDLPLSLCLCVNHRVNAP